MAYGTHSDHAAIVILANEASVDYRTIVKLQRGKRVSGLAGHRARAVLDTHGLPSAPPNATDAA